MTDHYITGGMNRSEYLMNSTVDKAREMAIKFLGKNPMTKAAKKRYDEGLEIYLGLKR